MQVGIVTPRYPPAISGGGEISVKLLADQLTARGVNVKVFSFDGASETEVDGVPVKRFRKPPHVIPEAANLYAAYSLCRVQDEISSCDIIHGYNVTLHPAVGYISSKLNIPSVATLNSYDLLPKSAFSVTASPARRLYELVAMPTTGRILRNETKRVSRFITLSEASRNVYRDNGFEGTPIDVIPNMIDPSFDVPDLESKTEGYQLLYVGSLIKEKGLAYLFQAMTRLPDDVTLCVVGSGGEKSRLHSLAQELDVTDRIEFTGPVPYSAVRRYYALADCFVHPGVWPEPFGRTLLEAMQAGLPVVATNIGGPAEFVRQEKLRCQPRNASFLADAILEARRSPGIGAANREYVNERFSPKNVVSELLNVYNQALTDS